MKKLFLFLSLTSGYVALNLYYLDFINADHIHHDSGLKFVMTGLQLVFMIPLFFRKKMKPEREKAMAWWNNLSLKEKFYKTIPNKGMLGGDATRHPSILTGREIEKLYFIENNQNVLTQKKS